MLNTANGLETLLLPMERILCMSVSLPMRYSFNYPVMPTKMALFGQWVICMRSRRHHYMIRRLEVVDCIMKSDNWPHILHWFKQLRTLLWIDSLPLPGHLHEDKIAHGCFQQEFVTGNTSHFYMRLLEDMFRDIIISKDIWPPMFLDLAPLVYYMCGAMKGKVHKDNPHTLPELKEAIANFIRSIFLNELLHVLANKMCRCVSTGIWVLFPTFSVTWISMGNVFVLI